MKLLYSFSLASLLIGGMAPQLQAQTQIPNSDFEGEWVNCIPWTFYQSEGYEGQPSEFVVGNQPTGWVISNVSGMVSYYEGEATGLGATIVGENVEGYESNSAVKLVNTPNPFLAAQIVPGYMTLGTSWSTANPEFSWTGITIKNSDGGSFGGQQFTERPTGIEFMYKRTRGESKPDETTTVVAYLWKGHWTQKDVPAIVYMAGDPVKVDMIDRDRCVLGMDMTGCQGGEVSKTDDAELIAVINAEITENADEWTKFTATFDYKTDATPEMINIIIAAGDYFGGAEAVGEGNSIIVDNVRLLYADDSAVEYPGYLNIEMMGAQIADNTPSAIQITPTSDTTCDFLLPDLTLTMDGSEMPLGDIELKGVAKSTVDGVTTYTGSQKGMSLMGGAIVADVDLAGTISDDNNVDMTISVTWSGIPINVSFTTDPKITTGIADIIVDNASAEYYNIQGVKVDGNNLKSGIYVKRQGNKAVMIYVR